MRCRSPIAAALAAAVAVAPAAANAPTSPAADAARTQAEAAPSPYAATLRLTRTIGSRPAGSPGELRAHRYVAGRFRAAGLRVGFERFGVPGHGAAATWSAQWTRPRAA
jgi:hypothetical protein